MVTSTLTPQPDDLEEQITKAWVEYINAKGIDAVKVAYFRFSKLVGLRRQPKKVS